MQYRFPVSVGPSSKTWPKWAWQFLQRTSVRAMPREWSSMNSNRSCATGSSKLGQPVPESNFAPEENNGSPQTAQRYEPSSWWFQYLPVNGASVPPSNATRRSSSGRDAGIECQHSRWAVRGKEPWATLPLTSGRDLPTVASVRGSFVYRLGQRLFKPLRGVRLP